MSVLSVFLTFNHGVVFWCKLRGLMKGDRLGLAQCGLNGLPNTLIINTVVYNETKCLIFYWACMLCSSLLACRVHYMTIDFLDHVKQHDDFQSTRRKGCKHVQQAKATKQTFCSQGTTFDLTYVFYFVVTRNPETFKPPPLLLVTPAEAANSNKPSTHHTTTSMYTISLLRTKWLARCKEPMKRITLDIQSINHEPLKHERISTNILRYIVQWARSLPFFKDLCGNDQYLMLEACWSELFVLVITQYQLLTGLAESVALLKRHSVNKTLLQIEAEINKCRALNCDDIEMECLKAIVLLNVGKLNYRKFILAFTVNQPMFRAQNRLPSIYHELLEPWK